MKKKTTALLGVGIPFLIGVCLIISFILAGILESPTNRGTIYALFLATSLFGSMLIPIPCIISSIVGIINAVKLRKLGQKAGYLIIFGLINIVCSFLVGIFWLYVIFIGGAGV